MSNPDAAEPSTRTVAIVGARGKIALALADLLVARGDAVRGVVRNAGYREELQARGITPVIVDLEADGATDELAAAFAGVDAVVFAAGAGPGSTAERKLTVDYGGAVHSADAAKQAGVERFVIVSSVGTDDPPDGDEIFSVYLRAKADADQYVRGSGLSHTIVRPGSLTDDDPSGTVSAARHVGSGKIARRDVAHVLLELLDNDASVGRTFEVVGGAAAIADAVDGLATQHETLD